MVYIFEELVKEGSFGTVVYSQRNGAVLYEIEVIGDLFGVNEGGLIKRDLIVFSKDVEAHQYHVEHVG